MKIALDRVKDCLTNVFKFLLHVKEINNFNDRTVCDTDD